MLKQDIDKVIQEKEEFYDKLLRLFSSRNVGIGLAIVLVFLYPRRRSVFVDIIIVGLAATPIIQIFATFILLIGRRKWRDLARRKYKNKLLEFIMSTHSCHYMHPLYFLEVCTNVFFTPMNIIWSLQEYLFRLQYRAIIKPEQLGIDSSAPETKI
jgi:hypothetical protein